MPKNKKQFRTAELPGDITANILHRLGAVEILESAQKVCTTWRRVCLDPAMWRVIHITHSPHLNLCRRAVDLSQGQLLDLYIDFSADDNLLNYILHRSSELKCLTLQDCYGITDKGLVEAVNKLPHLEELHLIMMPEVKAADITNFGISCPGLKSFTFNQHGFWDPSTDVYFDFEGEPNGNDYALAIAKNMPNLRHLCLIANSVNNVGLEAILDGCPKLESLDIRQCTDIYLHGALAKRCSEQIKHLKRPYDSVSSIEYDRAPNFVYEEYCSC